MPKLYITEFQTTPADPGNPIQTLNAAKLPFVASQVVDFSGSSTNSAPISSSSKFVRVLADADCCIAAGASPTATASSLRLVAGVAEYFGVNSGDRIAVIEAGA